MLLIKLFGTGSGRRKFSLLCKVLPRMQDGRKANIRVGRLTPFSPVEQSGTHFCSEKIGAICGIRAQQLIKFSPAYYL